MKRANTTPFMGVIGGIRRTICKHCATFGRPPLCGPCARITFDDAQGQCRNRAGRPWILRVVPRAEGVPIARKDSRGTLANIREAIELFLETLTDEERSAALSQEILTTSIEVNA
jgi:hypothetical protein